MYVCIVIVLITVSGHFSCFYFGMVIRGALSILFINLMGICVKAFLSFEYQDQKLHRYVVLMDELLFFETLVSKLCLCSHQQWAMLWVTLSISYQPLLGFSSVIFLQFSFHFPDDLLNMTVYVSVLIW